MPDAIQVTTTLPSREQADALSLALVDGGLAACVQVVGPITSTYRWRGDVEVAEEWLVIVKTTAERFADVERAIRERHPYEVPEVLATPVTGGSEGYLRWLGESVEPEPPSA